MKKQIKVFKLKYEQSQEIELPIGAQIVAIQEARSTIDQLYLWALIDPIVTTTVKRTFEVYFSDQDIDYSPGTFRQYINTLQERGKHLHIFELLAKPLNPELALDLG
jgi:hypothetical protein